MFRASDRFSVSMPEVPPLSWSDQPADELPVDVFGTEAITAACAPHGPGRDEWYPPQTGATMLRARVQGTFERQPPEPLAALAAEPLVFGDSDVLSRASVALADTERDARPEGSSPSAAGATQPLISVGDSEQTVAAAAGSHPGDRRHEDQDSDR